MVKWTRKKLIDTYFEFFKSKNHKVIPSAPLIPRNDPTVLFTTAGMHPLVPYLTGQPHPLGKRIVNVQKCIRTTDIEEVGDKVHHTFFEMLGNWSFGDYFKKEAIEWSFEFLTEKLGLEKEKLAVSCFKGDKDAPKDEESAKIWKSLGFPDERIAFLSKKDNWWGPAGKTGPCGPDTEMFYWSSKDPVPKKFDPKDMRWVEIWNDVFMEYNKNEGGVYEKLSEKNVDTGMGVERTVAILNGIEDNYMTEMWKPIIDEIENLSGKKYEDHKKEMRIIADHIKASVFMLADGVVPGNSGRGYVLRRLVRRSIVNLRELGSVGTDLIAPISLDVFKIYKDYSEIEENKNKIQKEISLEEKKFEKTLDKGLRIFEKFSEKKSISGKDAFLLYQSYGFPIELTQEIAKEKKIKVDIKEFDKELKKHQELSRTASAGTFKSGLSDNSKQTTKLHTATHILNEALRKVLGDHVKQRGSNINSERLRFDFSFDRKLTKEEISKIENLVNEKISQGLEVERSEMELKKALESGAQGEFGVKYPEKVSVYTIKDLKDKRNWFSKEICTGPHVENTKEIGKFKIIKETSSSAGVRRIKAIVD